MRLDKSLIVVAIIEVYGGYLRSIYPIPATLRVVDYESRHDCRAENDMFH